MAITADRDLIESVLKKSMLGIKTKDLQIVSEKAVRETSNSITSLQNAFNKIYTATRNVKNIQQQSDRRLQNRNKEITMETKLVSSASPAGMEYQIDAGLFMQLSRAVDELANNLDKLNLMPSECACDSGSEIDIDIDRRRSRGRGRGLLRGLGTASRFILGAGAATAGLIGLSSLVSIGSGDEESKFGGFGGGKSGGGGASGDFGGFSGGGKGFDGGGASGSWSEGPSASSRKLERATTKVVAQRAKLEKVSGPGPASFSSRFSDFISQTISNMSSWALAASPLLAGAMAAYRGLSNYFSGDGAGSTENAEAAMQYFMSQEWTREQAAGIVGNLQAESGPNLNPNAIGENDVRPGVHSYGIAQWNRGRWAGLQSFAQNKGKPWNDFQTQLEYVQHELNTSHKRVADQLRNISDAATAANLINQQYEVSADRSGKRAANAIALLTPSATMQDLSGINIDRSAGGTGRLTSLYGMRGGRLHKGIDIAAPTGTPVAAAYDGTIAVAGSLDGYGNAIYINHDNGYSTRYAHLSAYAPGIRSGIRVSAGQIIGAVGNTGASTGPHLHYELRGPNGPVNPLNSYRNRPWIVGGRVVPGAALSPSAQRRRERPNEWAGVPYAPGTRNRDLPFLLGGGPPPPPPRGWMATEAWLRFQRR